MSVIGAEYRRKVGVKIISNLLYGVGKQIVYKDVWFSMAGG